MTCIDLWCWLITVFLKVKQIVSLLNFYLICISRQLLDQVNTSLIPIIKTGSWPLNQFPGMKPVYRPTTFNVGKARSPQKRISLHYWKFILVIFPPSPKGTYGFYQGNCVLGERKLHLSGTARYWLLIDTDSRILFMVTAQVPECILGRDKLNNRQNPYTGSLTCGGRAIMEKDKMQAIQTAPS